jgi:hypothetical protein
MEGSIAEVAYTSSALVAVLSLPSLWRLAKTPWRVKTPNLPLRYEDDDGVATEESMARFSVKRPLIVIFVGAPLGIAASFGLAVWGTIPNPTLADSGVLQLWLLFASWVCVPVCVLKTGADSW